MLSQLASAREVIALDLMGGDGAPYANVEGCQRAVDSGARILALGTAEAVELLNSKVASSSVETEVWPEVIEPHEPPLQAIRRKQDSSIYRGLLAVKEGRAGALVSGGSTGALVAGGVLVLGRVPGVDKPCLGTVIPSVTGRGTFFVDLGASSDVRPQTLVQFAVMGYIYAREVLGWQDPNVCLLNIGQEAQKGNTLARKTYELLEKAPIRFGGNIEARDVFSGVADVVVTDGFTGNIFLKTCEGTAGFQLWTLKRELSKGPLRKAAALLLKPAFNTVRALLDYTAYGGAPLMGLNGCVVKCHGSSDGNAVFNGIREARAFLERDVADTMIRTLSEVTIERE
ncbi:MAG: phosphate acyltransferase PlsX [Bacillota bacterium]